MFVFLGSVLLVNIGCSRLGYSTVDFSGLIFVGDISQVPSGLLGFLLRFHLVGSLVS